MIDYFWMYSLCLVIFFHTPPRFEPRIDEIVWYVSVACFFFVSGILFHFNCSLKKFMSKTAERLIWPSFVCYIIFYCLWVFFGRYHAGIEDLEARWYDPLIEFITGHPTLVAAPLWFIVVLIVIRTISYGLCKINSIFPLLSVTILITLTASFLSNDYFCLRFAALFFIWHTLGILFQLYLLKRFCTIRKPNKYIIHIKGVGVIILAIQNYVIGCLKIGYNHFFNDLNDSTLFTKFFVSAIAIVLTISIALTINKVFPVITKPSLIRSWKRK